MTKSGVTSLIRMGHWTAFEGKWELGLKPCTQGLKPPPSGKL